MWRSRSGNRDGCAIEAESNALRLKVFGTPPSGGDPGVVAKQGSTVLRSS